MAQPAVSGIFMTGMLDMSCPAWVSGFGDALLPTVPDISIPGMAPIPDMSSATPFGFATGAPRLVEAGLAAGLPAIFRVTSVPDLGAGLFFVGAFDVGMLTT